ncbi:MAG: DUF420 domain-containing protein [Deltaproteobacteria bacterium]|nr:DUF420 domain-containing protein [Deltaproteobacteria bacterium]
MIPIRALPSLNAFLNTTSAVLLVLGYAAIRRRDVHAHRRCMLAAFAASMLFLLSYVRYHVAVGSVPFGHPGWLRTVYFVILVPHVMLAAAIVPLALWTLNHAWRGRYHRHARIAKITLPLWLYVSVTGVIVYLMLYCL